MNAVLRVKASYVASTKYPRQAASAGLNSKPIVVWKMRAPGIVLDNKPAHEFQIFGNGKSFHHAAQTF